MIKHDDLMRRYPQMSVEGIDFGSSAKTGIRSWFAIQC